jgi:hypothetical protein
VALEGLLQGPRGRIPELDCAIVGAGRYQLAVRGECHRVDPAGVALEGLLQGPRGRIPEFDRAIAGAGRHQLAVRGECHRANPAGVALERLLQGVPITWDLWQPTDPTWDLI